MGFNSGLKGLRYTLMYRDSAVDTAIGYGLDGPGIESRRG
jgi:hypothetical protein